MDSNNYKLSPTEARKAWVDNLRSGRFVQGYDALHTIDKGEERFCCLGVLCRTFMECEGIELETKTIGRESLNSLKTPMVFYEDSASTVPEKVGKWVGLATADGTYQDGRGALWRDNDVAQLTFNEIADIIEMEPDGLFTELTRSCPSCQLARINGVLCHEQGCPDSHLYTTRECKWCGRWFQPQSNSQQFCEPECGVAYRECN